MRFPIIELIDKLIFKTCGIEITGLMENLESHKYSAHGFALNGIKAQFQLAKITPSKTGQFVTIWQRDDKGITQPYKIDDNFTLYIIAVKDNNKQGVFIFPKAELYKHKILAGESSKGKRGIRVYASWDAALSKQAQKTKNWQTQFFIDLSSAVDIDITLAKNLLGNS